MDDLIAFVAARLDEIEAVARSAVEWWPFGGFDAAASIPGGGPLYVWAHVTGHDPARVLRQVEAGRARVALYLDLAAEFRRTRHGADMMRRDALLAVLRCDAAVDSGHPDYRPEWKP